MRSLLLPGMLGLVMGFLGYWGWGVVRGQAGPVARESAAASDLAGGRPAAGVAVAQGRFEAPPFVASPMEEAAGEAEIFKVSPQDQWVKMPRGLMEHANSPFDTLLFVCGSGEDNDFWPTMMPGTSEATLQAIAAPLIEFSKGWTEMAVANLERSGPDEWLAILPPDQIERLRKELESRLTNSLPTGYAHLVRFLAYQPLAMLSVSTFTLKLDPSSDEWELAINGNGSFHMINLSEEHLAPDAMVRDLFKRAKTLK